MYSTSQLYRPSLCVKSTGTGISPAPVNSQITLFIQRHAATARQVNVWLYMKIFTIVCWVILAGQEIRGRTRRAGHAIVAIVSVEVAKHYLFNVISIS